MKDSYDDFLGKTVIIMNSHYSSTRGILEEYDRDRFLFKVYFTGGGLVLVKLEDVKFITPK